MGKVYTRFQTKNGAKTILFGAAHTYMAYIREYPPRITVGPCGLVLSNSKVYQVTPLFFYYYHISGFNSPTIISTAFRAGTYNSFLGRTTRFK